MGDRTLLRELKRWATEEFNLPPQSLPNDNYFKTLCVGPGASIWRYVTQHIFNQRNVRVMRGNLQWYKVLQDKELKKVAGQSDAAKQLDLQEQIEELRAELNHLDSQINGTEAQLATEEESINRSWGMVEENQRRELILQAFKQRCMKARHSLSEDTRKISGHSQALEQLSRKAEVEVVFGNETSNSSGDYLNPTGAEPQVLRNVRELCDERLLFFQSLQESELKIESSTATHLTREQRTAVFQHWLSAVEDLLRCYPPNQVLSALQYLALGQEITLEEKLASLDVARDVAALRFHYESNHLLDIWKEEEELPPVKSLLQSAWQEVEQSLMELAQTRSQIQQLKTQLHARKKEAELELLCVESQTQTLARSVFELEMQCVMQTAVRDGVQDQCVQMEQHARDRQEALRNLRSQWQSIMDFRQLVDVRQEQTRGLIKGNSTAKTELTRVHKKIGQFVQGKLTPQLFEVLSAANGLRNSVSQEAKQFGNVSLVTLDRRIIEGEQRIPAAWLSIHRLHSSPFRNLCQSLAFPMYRAPEELYSQALSQHLELRFLRRLLQLHSSSLANVEKQGALLPAPDQQALLLCVREEDKKLLQSLLPRVRELNQYCSQGLSYGNQVKTAISYWWDQPAQFALPDICKGGLTFQQWLQRWKFAAKAS
ncbi:HAUS augmin-like complex subunit 5 [Coregonus clupeaformis]|uniref:HAUS augmin-like complex subunit 5 n=1 Tax=Coregonus clupeaformis TaxID=59861 RepID=UPI001E1C295C|nr:HAUS augmin-like complex subunit 5 [Coregonus clupeaformis]XP_041704866.2 HAUS augmin-like complex subunit 5 [Coregonus clupeaformis]